MQCLCDERRHEMALGEDGDAETGEGAHEKEEADPEPDPMPVGNGCHKPRSRQESMLEYVTISPCFYKH